jgi:hypothetical protein
MAGSKSQTLRIQMGAHAEGFEVIDDDMRLA